MKYSAQISILMFSDHGNGLCNRITGVNYNGQDQTGDRPFDLLVKSLVLFFFKTSVPIKIQADFSDRCKSPAGKTLLNMLQCIF